MERNRPNLGEHLFTFAVISDTHVNPDEETCNSPFPVNARANPRFRHVIADLNQREIDFVIHLGDLVHPVPETGNLYARAARACREIAAGLSVPITHVPGNHDIGDTPVKGAPASPATRAMIAAWEAEFGPQYQAFSHGAVRFILLNAQLINTGLPDEARQRHWVEAELEVAERRVMLHHPPYVCFPDEPGHHDNTDPPGRGWLLGLLERHNVEAIFAGHAHNFWYDRVAQTDYYLAPSTSFVRQDYSEMLRIAPPEMSEFGRDIRIPLADLRDPVRRQRLSVATHLGNQSPVADTLPAIEWGASERGLAASVHLRVAGDNPAEPRGEHDETCARVATALEIAPTLSAARLFCDTLADNERGYFPRSGAIDRAGNPNRLSDMVRLANQRAWH